MLVPEGVAVEGIVAVYSHAAVHMLSGVSNFVGAVRGIPFGNMQGLIYVTAYVTADVFASGFSAVCRVSFGGAHEIKRAGCGEFCAVHMHELVGQTLSHSLEGGNRAAELFTGAGVFGCHLEGFVQNADLGGAEQGGCGPCKPHH